MAIPSDVFLAALDGRAIPVGGTSWTLEIYAIIVEANRRWIQTHAVGPARVPLRINASLGTSPTQIVAAVVRHLQNHSTADADDLAGATLVVDGELR
jgi:hypothetical protein